MTVLLAMQPLAWKKYRQKYRHFVGISLDSMGWMDKQAIKKPVITMITGSY